MDSRPVAATSLPPEVAPSGTLQIPLPSVEQDQLVAKGTASPVTPTSPAPSLHHRYNASLRVLTNVTEFEYKLEFYSNRLDLFVDRRLLAELPDRGTRPPKEEPVFDAGTQGIQQKKKILLELYNPNPVQVIVEHISSNVSTSHIVLPSPPPWNLAPYRALQLALTLSSPDEGRIWGLLSVKTDFHSQSWPFVFQTSKGTVTAAAGLNSGGTSRSPGVVSVEGAFPFRLSSELIYLESSFDSPLVVAGARVEGDDQRFSIDLVESPVLHPGAKSLLGTLLYRPSCSTPTSCYVGLGGPLDSSSSKDLYLWRGMQERLKETRALNVSLIVDTLSVKGFVIPITVSHVWPRVTPRGAVRFETTRLGDTTETPVVVDNPSDQPLMMQAYVSTTGGPEVHSIVAAQHAIKLGHLSSAFSLARSVQNSLSVIPPRSKKKILVRFEPPTIGPHVGVLVVRNNLTAVSSVLLRGEGGVGKLLLAGQEPGGTILFDLNAALLKDCGNIGLYTTLKKYPVAKNVGQLPIRVRRVLINERECVGYGFRVKDCEDFVIKPNASHRIELSFTPDFTVSRVEVVLSLVLDDSTLDFNLVVTLPKSVVSTCAEQVVRPSWEGTLYVVCLILSSLFVACILCYAFLDSNRVLQETLWCDRPDSIMAMNSRSNAIAAHAATAASAARNGGVHNSVHNSASSSNNVNHVNHSARNDSRNGDANTPGSNTERSVVVGLFSYGKRMLIDLLSPNAASDESSERGGSEQRNSVATQTGMDGDANGHAGSPTASTAVTSTNTASLCHYDRKGSLQRDGGGAGSGQTGGANRGAGAPTANATAANNRRRDSGLQNSKKDSANQRNRNKKKDYTESCDNRMLTRRNSADVVDDIEIEAATQTSLPAEQEADDDYNTVIDSDTNNKAGSDRADNDGRDRSTTPVEVENETTSEDSSEASNESAAVVEVTQTIEEVSQEKLNRSTKDSQKSTRRERKEKRRKRECNDSPISHTLTPVGRGSASNNNNKEFKEGGTLRDLSNHTANNNNSNNNNGHGHNHRSQSHHNGLSATLPDVCVPAANAQRKPPPHTPSPPAEQQSVNTTATASPSMPSANLGGSGRERRRDSRGGDVHSRHEREIPPRFKKQQMAASFRAALPSLSPRESGRQLTTAVAPGPRTISYSAVVSGGQSPPLTFPNSSNSNSCSSSANSAGGLACAGAGSGGGGHLAHSLSLGIGGHATSSTVIHNNSASSSGPTRRLGSNPPPGFPLRPSLAGSFSSGGGLTAGTSSIGGYAISSGVPPPLNGLHCGSSADSSNNASGNGESCGSDEQEMAPLIRSIIDSVIPTERDERLSMSWLASNAASSTTGSGPASLGKSANATGASAAAVAAAAASCNSCSVAGTTALSGPANSCTEDMGGMHTAKGSMAGGRSSGRSLWGDSTWRSSATNAASNQLSTPLSPTAQMSSSSSSPPPSQASQASGLSSGGHDSACGFGSAGTSVPVSPPSQTFPTFLRRTPERDRERDRREMGLDLHQRHLAQSVVETGPQSGGQQSAAWSPTNATPRHLPMSRFQQLHRMAHPPAVSPTNDYSYTGADIWGSGTSGLSPTQPSIFPSPIGTPWTPFRSPSLSLSAVREEENTSKKTQ